jgi:hypothetical protein
MKKTGVPIAGGIISIVVGAIGLLIVITLGIGLGIAFASPNLYFDNRMMPAFTGVFIIVGIVIYFILNAITIAGGVFALQRRMWGFALAGAICSFLSGWGWMFGVAAIVLISISKSEFDYVIPPPPPSAVVPPPISPPPSPPPPAQS